MTGSRVRYRDGQLLRAADLLAEQAYRREQRRRHNVAQHGWGIVHGLRISATGAGVAVEPGIAIDGYGRELVLGGEQTVEERELSAVDAGCVAIWLILCSVPDSAPGGGMRDEVRVYLSPCGDLSRAPAEVPPADRDYPPQLAVPDRQLWPVFLEMVKADASGAWEPVNEDWRRSYASVNGWSVATPPGTARMRIGHELVSDRTRFAVAIPDATGQWIPHLAVDAEGRTRITGDLRVMDVEHSSNLVVDSTGQSGPFGLVFAPPVVTPKKAMPWRIYRTLVEENGQQIDELRIEILDPGKAGDPARDLLALGHHDGATFVPCLTVSAGCTVTIPANANLNVTGSITQAPLTLDPDDPRFAEALAEALAEGDFQGLLQATPTDYGALDLTISATNPIHIGDDLTYDVAVANARNKTVIPVVVYATVTVGGVTQLPRKIGDHVILNPGETVTFDDVVAVANAAAGDVEIAVSASGVSLGPVIAFGEAGRTISVN